MAELVAADSALFAALADHAAVGVFVCDQEGSCVYANERLCKLVGLTSAQVVGGGWTRAVHPDDAPRVQAEWAAASVDGLDFHSDYRFLRPDGSVRWVEGSAAPVCDGAGKPLRWVGCCVDLTAHRLRDQRFEQLFEQASDAIFVLEADGEISAINRAAEALTGYRRGELVGMNVFDLIAPDNVERAREVFHLRLTDVASEMAEYQMINKGGTRVFVEISGRLVETDGRALGIEAIARDSSERHAFEQRLLHEALHDHLTGLPNRTLFLERLGQALARATGSESKVAVMLLDLDNFKRVNGSLGHAVGDELLVRLAERLGREVPQCVARLGGDEFAFLFEDFRREQIWVAERLLAAIAEPVPDRPDVTASLGVAIAEPTDTADSVLSNADSAMRAAKKLGSGSFEIFDGALRSRLLRELALTKALTRALRDGKLDVYYQPIVALNAGRILGLEALARWNDPEWGWVAPDEFIPMAEEHGLIVALGQYVFSQAAKQAATWRTNYPHALPLGVFVNVSPLQLSQPDFADIFTRALEQHGTTPSDIGIEITERVLIDHNEKALADNLAQLTSLGVRISLDDFGTGYASLTALKELPLTVLKVDRSFISAIQKDSAPITRASVALGHTLGLTVVAEGVETQLQADYLNRVGCDGAQGYHFARPQPADQITALLQAAPDTWGTTLARRRRSSPTLPDTHGRRSPIAG